MPTGSDLTCEHCRLDRGGLGDLARRSRAADPAAKKRDCSIGEVGNSRDCAQR